jgi:hypothetical protein
MRHKNVPAYVRQSPTNCECRTALELNCVVHCPAATSMSLWVMKCTGEELPSLKAQAAVSFEAWARYEMCLPYPGGEVPPSYHQYLHRYYFLTNLSRNYKSQISAPMDV